jgi:hypothetical protein
VAGSGGFLNFTALSVDHAIPKRFIGTGVLFEYINERLSETSQPSTKITRERKRKKETVELGIGNGSARGVIFSRVVARLLKWLTVARHSICFAQQLIVIARFDITTVILIVIDQSVVEIHFALTSKNIHFSTRKKKERRSTNVKVVLESEVLHASARRS